MTPTDNWPVVHEQDHGIRPAGRQDSCFYCGKKIGEIHSKDCVIVTKRVLLSIKSYDGDITGTWETDEPHSFGPEMIEFRYNDRSWCANNILSEKDVVWDQVDAARQLEAQAMSGCLCGVLQLKFERVVDDTPRRKLAPPPNDDR
jgi:hypothetical protein